MEEESGSLRDEVRELRKVIEEKDKPKEKKFKIPFKARINKRRAREGYVTAFVVNENKNIDIRRVQIEDSTFKLGDSIHSLEEEDIYFYKGKPLIIQAKTKLNPFSYFADYNTADNQTYGEKYVLAKLEAERIKPKGKLGGLGMSIIGIIVAAIIGYAFLTGGGG